MPTESGDMKLLGNFRNLIDFVTAETGFKPANAKIKPPRLFRRSRTSRQRRPHTKRPSTAASQPMTLSIQSSCARAIC
jgi:hypothetical protein